MQKSVDITVPPTHTPIKSVRMQRRLCIALVALALASTLHTAFAAVPAYGTPAAAQVFNNLTNMSWTCLSPISSPIYLGLSECPVGFVCANFVPNDTATYPQYCAPTVACQLTRLASGFCAEPQGVFDPVLCQEGFVCPNGLQRFDCPAGAYCPRGAQQPIKCNSLMYCPLGSAAPLDFSGVIVTMLLELISLALIVTCLKSHQGQVFVMCGVFLSIRSFNSK